MAPDAGWDVVASDAGDVAFAAEAGCGAFPSVSAPRCAVLLDSAAFRLESPFGPVFAVSCGFVAGFRGPPSRFSAGLLPPDAELAGAPLLA